MNNMTPGITPKQATIIGIEQIPSRHGGWIYDVKFDNGWRCYVDPHNNNYARWRQICERKQLVTLRGLKAKSKHKRIYNADSRIHIVGHAMSDQPTQYEQLFDGLATPTHRLTACDFDTVAVLLRDLLPREYPQFQANCDDSETELHLNVNNVRYIIPIV